MKSKPTLLIQSVIFDMDGVITKTATVHATAWQEMFNEFLQFRSKKYGESFKPFTYEEDYLTFVDGKPRIKGIESFLESRNIVLPIGREGDAFPQQETIHALAHKKNSQFVEVIQTQGVELYPSTISLINELKSWNIRVGVASSSKNCELVLEAAKIDHLFETRVDGSVSEQLGLMGKPNPDIFIEAARNLGCDKRYSIVVEDAVSGVQAGHRGDFGLVLGIAREDNQMALKDNGADVVVDDLDGVTTEVLNQWLLNKMSL